ncbi:MAG: hypothetical protein ACKVOW_03020 [Chitinophagaceae bacterium]
MTQTTLTAKKVATIGEEIGVELGTQMVKGYQQANPSDVHSYLIGRDIIDQILAQPGCVGIKFYNAYNEIGEKTLVYTGVDTNGISLLAYKVVNPSGQLEIEKGIVADRVRNCSRDRIEEEGEWWIAD